MKIVQKWCPHSTFNKLLPKFFALAEKVGPVMAAIRTYNYWPDAQVSAIMAFYRACGVPLPKRGYNILSPEEKQRIVEMFIQGYSVSHIAKQLNRHPSTVYYFLKRLGLN